MLESIFEGVVTGVCIVAVFISLLLLAKFVHDGVVIALRPIPMVDEDLEPDPYATEHIQECKP
jgi:hypothetical protein